MWRLATATVAIPPLGLYPRLSTANDSAFGSVLVVEALFELSEFGQGEDVFLASSSGFAADDVGKRSDVDVDNWLFTIRGVVGV